jgi:hypothetical protein
MRDATHPQPDFLATELLRFGACGAWERAYNIPYVSRMFLVPKPGVNKGRRIIDFRELNSYCAEINMACEALKHLRHLSCPGGYFFSLDLADGLLHPRHQRRGPRRTTGANFGASRAFQWDGRGPPITSSS